MEGHTTLEQKPVNSVSPLKVPRKRKRIIISCTECHRRKQKCDRDFPCSNCVARNKESLCQYENESARKQQLLEESKADGDRLPGFETLKSREPDATVAAFTAFGYTKANGHNNTTMGIYDKISSYDKGHRPIADHRTYSGDHGGLREKYKSHIRQLPAKEFIEKLVSTFFRQVNYQYYALDESIFREILGDWDNLSLSTLNAGPLTLPPDVMYFPALLFQVLALSLQYQPPDYEPSLNSLKYVAGMSLEDLAQDYSQSGKDIVSLLPKQAVTLVTVQAGFLRTSFLKHCGMIPESWHSLSETIKFAQEIGLHKGTMPYVRKPDNSKDILEGLWEEQMRKRMWTILSLWDIHMAIVLGRPPTIDYRDAKPGLPIDAPIPKNRHEVAPVARNPHTDRPTPLTMLLWSAEISSPLWDIYNLEREDPNQNNFTKVATMHDNLNFIAKQCPPYFRLHNPDTTFDSHPECYWLQCVRPSFQISSAFSIMALHRPYIFTNPSSRTEAVKAGLEILRAQRCQFTYLSVIHYKMFALVLNTFDAIVLIAAIYIIHPQENREHLDDAIQHFEWSMERFEAMSARNSMASGALGILKAMHTRLKKVLSVPDRKIDPELVKLPIPDVMKNSKAPTLDVQFFTPQSSISSASSAAVSNGPVQSITPSSNSTSDSQSNATPSYTLPTISNLTEATPAPSAEWAAFSSDVFPKPSIQNQMTLDFSQMQPLQPMHDLLYNNLDTVINGDGLELGGVSMQTPGVAGGVVSTAWGTDSTGNWTFEGDFGNDSFWGLMNNYNPA